MRQFSSPATMLSTVIIGQEQKSWVEKWRKLLQYFCTVLTVKCYWAQPVQLQRNTNRFSQWSTRLFCNIWYWSRQELYGVLEGFLQVGLDTMLKCILAGLRFQPLKPLVFCLQCSISAQDHACKLSEPFGQEIFFYKHRQNISSSLFS